jgi:hypothetical protein
MIHGFNLKNPFFFKSWPIAVFPHWNDGYDLWNYFYFRLVNNYNLPRAIETEPTQMLMCFRNNDHQTLVYLTKDWSLTRSIVDSSGTISEAKGCRWNGVK